MKKLLSKKKFLVIVSVLFLIYIFRACIEYYNFDFQAEDLINSDTSIERIKQSLLFSIFSAWSLKFEFMTGIGVFIPIVALIISYDYEKIKNNYLKYNIGKNNKYSYENKKLKIKLSILSVLPVIFVYSIMTIISISIIGYLNVKDISGGMFSSNSILNKIFIGDLGYYVFVILSISFSTLLITYLSIVIVEKYSFIKGTFILLGFLWIGSVLIYSSPLSIVRFVVPMESIMGIVSGEYSIIKLILDKISLIIFIISLELLKRNELR